jgi:hypothetical protein
MTTISNAPALAGMLVLVAVAGCSPVPALSPPGLPAETVLANDATSQSRAFFPAFPDRLLSAAVAACNSPGQRPESPDASTVRCLSLPTPDVAAALILSYDGTVSDLPLYVVSFDTMPSEGGYVVTADSYVTVPQTDGSVRTVRLLDPNVTSGMMDLLVAAGGTAVPG